MERDASTSPSAGSLEAVSSNQYRPFTVKRWNACATWTWDVECDTCAICRVQLMEECLPCQAKQDEVGVRRKSGIDGQVRRGVFHPCQKIRNRGVDYKWLQTSGPSECVVVWGECSHSFHNCCMSQWVRQNARCPLCQQDWNVARIGK